MFGTTTITTSSVIPLTRVWGDSSVERLTLVSILFGIVLENKGEQFARKENGEQQNSLEQRINLIENLVMKISSDIIALRRVIDENHDKLNVLNANMNTLTKHVVGDENMKYNKDTSATCGTPYDVHP